MKKAEVSIQGAGHLIGCQFEEAVVPLVISHGTDYRLTGQEPAAANPLSSPR